MLLAPGTNGVTVSYTMRFIYLEISGRNIAVKREGLSVSLRVFCLLWRKRSFIKGEMGL